MDWVGTGLSLTGAYLVSVNVKTALIVWIASNLIWIVWAIATKQWSVLALNAAFLAVNVRSFYARQD